MDENETQGVSLEDAQKEILRQKLAGRDRRFFLLDPGKKQADNDYAHSGFVTIREAHLFTPAVILVVLPLVLLPYLFSLLVEFN